MFKRLLVGVAFLSLGAFGLQAQSTDTQSQSGSQQQYGTQSGSQSDSQSNMQGQPSQQSQLSSTDQNFIKKAYQSNLSEIQLGQIAAQRSSNNDVKQYAQQLVDDHQKANDQLQQIASQKGVTLPSSAQPSQQARFSNISGPAFDRLFVRHQAIAHKQAIALFKREAQNGQDPDVKSFASNQLGALQQHENMANDLRSKIMSSSSSARNQSGSSSSYAGSSTQSTDQTRDQSANMNEPGTQSSSSTSSSTSNTTNNYQASNRTANQRLPRTGSNMPLVGLFGFMLIGAAFVARSFRLLRNNR